MPPPSRVQPLRVAAGPSVPTSRGRSRSCGHTGRSHTASLPQRCPGVENHPLSPRWSPAAQGRWGQAPAGLESPRPSLLRRLGAAERVPRLWGWQSHPRGGGLTLPGTEGVKLPIALLPA